MSNSSPIKVFITGAANGLAEVREGLADHPEVELVGTAADPAKAGPKLAESAAQVILHGTSATDHVPLAEIEAIRAVTAAPIILVTSASANSILGEALSAGIFDVVLLPQLTDGIVFTIKKAHAAGRRPRRRRPGQGLGQRRGQGRQRCSRPRAGPARRRSPATWLCCSPAGTSGGRCSSTSTCSSGMPRSCSGSSRTRPSTTWSWLVASSTPTHWPATSPPISRACT